MEYANGGRCLGLSAALVLLPWLAAADSGPVADLTASVAVRETCTLAASGYLLAFGTYDPVAANRSVALDGEVQLLARCTDGFVQRITLSQGASPAPGSSDEAPRRRMSNGASRLAYQLYTTAARSAVWGNTADTGVAITGDGAYRPVVVYGRIPAGQVVPKGTYVDYVLVTFSN
jgi:spore coat protein U-like protein